MTPKIEALAEDLETLRSEITELDAIEEPTDDQAARYEAIIGEWDEKKAEHDKLVARAEKVAAVRTAALNPRNVEKGFHAPNVIVRTDPFENVEALRFADPNSEEVISRAVTAISEVKSRYTSDAHRESAVRMIEMIPGAAVHALVHGSPAYRSAFEMWLKTQGSGDFWSDEEKAAVRASLSLTGANGGYTLPTLLDPTLIHTGTAVKNPLRAISRVETITQNVWHGVSVGNVTAYWTAEAAAFTDGTPTFSNPSITAAKLTAFVTGSIEIFEDSASIGQLPGLIGEGMGYVESTAFISGSGSGAPKGIITAISATAGSTVTATTRGSFTTASSVDVYAVVNAVTPRYEESAQWIGNKAQFNVINQMSPSGGGSLFWGNFDQAGFQKPPLLGSPVSTSSDMTAGMTSGSVLLVLGDFSQYLIVDRIGMTLEFEQNIFNSSALPTGNRGLIAHKRVGADCTDINAFRFLKA